VLNFRPGQTLPVRKQENSTLIVFCKRDFPTFAKVFPQAPVGNLYVNPSGFRVRLYAFSAASRILLLWPGKSNR